MISSVANAQVKHVRRLQNEKRYRQRQQVFVLEGMRLLRELTEGRQTAVALYYTADWLDVDEHGAFIESHDLSGKLVTSAVMAAMSATETPSGVLAEVRMRPMPLPEEPTLVLILDAVTTPGNLGSMLRTAGAAGVDAVLLGPGCVDAYNPKVVRGGMGAHFRVAVHELNWPEIAAYCKGLDVRLSAVQSNKLYTAVDWQKPSAVIVGNEARGAGGEAYEVAAETITIPMAGETESLNAATSAAVILFEAFRQRDFTADDR